MPLESSAIRISPLADSDVLSCEVPPLRQWRRLESDAAVRIGVRAEAGARLTLDLFPDAVFTGCSERVSVNVNGTRTVRGGLEGYPLGSLIFTTTGGRTFGTIDVPERGRRFVIQSGKDGLGCYLLELDPDHETMPRECPPVLPPQNSGMASYAFAEAPVYDLLAPVVIDVMIVYTPAARAWADAHGGGIDNVIAQGMARAQLTLDNSRTYASFRLVHSAEVAYSEVGQNGQIDLGRLQRTDDGYLDEVHVWRDRQRADLVSLLAICSDVGGVAYGMTRGSGHPDYAFSVVDVEYAGTTFALVHELGHNLGCGHAIAQIISPGPGLFPYSAGWRWDGLGGKKYCSVMSYTSGSFYQDGFTRTATPYFSNPAVLDNGAATGNAVFGDNVRTIRETKGVVAQYRTAAWDAGFRELGGGWRRLDWFGDYVPMSGDGWIWHNQHGFLYIPLSTTSSDIWMYANDLGWLWTSSTIYPYLYRDRDGAWLWYNGATAPRWFRNMTAGNWEFW